MKRFHDYHNDPTAQNEEHHSQYLIKVRKNWQKLKEGKALKRNN